MASRRVSHARAKVPEDGQRPPSPTVRIFADESGNLAFNRNRGSTRNFLIASVTANDPDLGNEFNQLRQDLAWRGLPVDGAFHATEDQQAVRNAVFAFLKSREFRVDISVFDKPRTYPRLARDVERFLKTAWWLHFKYVIPSVAKFSNGDHVLVVVSSILTRRRRFAIREGIVDIVQQVTRCPSEVAFWPADADPCLQIADYVAWAAFRKYENNDHRSYDLIKDKIVTEFETFRRGRREYY